MNKVCTAIVKGYHKLSISLNSYEKSNIRQLKIEKYQRWIKDKSSIEERSPPVLTNCS